MKLYECIIDDNTNVFKTVLAAKNKKALISEYGNWTFEKIKDISQDIQCVSIGRLQESLVQTGWEVNEIILITALLEQHLKSLYITNHKKGE